MERIKRSRLVLAVVAALVGAGLFAGGSAWAGGGFSDTPPWIAAHANWAFNNGIANGYPDGTFRPNDNITRGQTAFWLGNYNDAIEVVSRGDSFANENGTFVSQFCPFGKRAVAAGGYTSASGMVMQDSFPVTNGQGQSGWQINWLGVNGPATGNAFIDVLCLPDEVPSL